MDFLLPGPKAFRLDQARSSKATEKGISSNAAARDFVKGAHAANECTGDNANSELSCTLKDGRVGWCKGGTCKDVCPAGFSYSPNDTRCHQYRDCRETSGDSTPAKTAQCDNCMGVWCMDENASRDMK